MGIPMYSHGGHRYGEMGTHLEGMGMRTVSTVPLAEPSPGLREKTSFRVPSRAAWTDWSDMPPDKLAEDVTCRWVERVEI